MMHQVLNIVQLQLPNVGVYVSVIMCIHVHVCVAPPTVVGAWLMAGTLWWLFF